MASIKRKSYHLDVKMARCLHIETAALHTGQLMAASQLTVCVGPAEIVAAEGGSYAEGAQLAAPLLTGGLLCILPVHIVQIPVTQLA